MNKFNDKAIQEAAYYIWQNAGCPQGQDEYFWTMAVEQLSCNCNKSSCCKKSSSNSKTSAAKKTSAPKKTASSTSTKKSK